MKSEISQFSHPLNGEQKRTVVEFVDLACNKVKINNKWYKAYLIGGISLREEDYREIFSQ